MSITDRCIIGLVGIVVKVERNYYLAKYSLPFVPGIALCSISVLPLKACQSFHTKMSLILMARKHATGI